VLVSETAMEKGADVYVVYLPCPPLRLV
jgi:hypothetical protein